MLMLLPLQACKTGAETLPDLAAKIFDALQANSKKNLMKAAPTQQEYEEAYYMFYFHKFQDKAELKKEAKDKAASMQLNLKTGFDQLIKTAQEEKNLDWANTKIRDLKYNIKDRKEGFQEAKVRMIVETGIEKNVVLFDAIQYEKRWYLVDNFRWEE
jgi:hypothetical protein